METKDFFKMIFRDHEGFLCISKISPKDENTITDAFFHYPQEVEQAARYARQKSTSNNVYFSPSLFKQKTRKDANVNKYSTIAWIDLDTVDPLLVSPTPDLTVMTSPGRYQSYWYQPDTTLTTTAHERSQNISTQYHSLGSTRTCSPSGLLRVPNTRNYKYGTPGPEISIHDILTAEQVIEQYQLSGNTRFKELFTDIGPNWGSRLWELEGICYLASLTRMETFTVVEASACNSYKRDGLPKTDLLVEIDKIYTHNGQVATFLRDTDTPLTLLPHSIVDEYADYASLRTDAPYQYHIACGLAVLSTVVSPYISFPTSANTIRGNIWVSILAGTTNTRKSTSMDLATKLLDEIHHDYLMGTDGSPEGIMGELAERNGRVSLFHRDEITGLIEGMAKKEYMSGMMELFTRLYDGKKEKRILRKITLEVDNPYFIIMSGGIKKRFVELVSKNMIDSGFVPRFILVTGQTDSQDMKPIGPPTSKIHEGHQTVLSRFKHIYNYYITPERTIKIGSVETGEPKHVYFHATPAVWERMEILQRDAIKLSELSEDPDISGPVYARMSDSIIKVSLLLAASRLSDTIEIEDLHKAIHYSQVWLESAHEIVQITSKTQGENENGVLEQKILDFITQEEKKKNVTRRDVMRKFGIKSGRMDEIEKTMIQQGLIVKAKMGRANYYRTSAE